MTSTSDDQAGAGTVEPLRAYGHAAPLYEEAGWAGILPLPAGKKASPPSGTTGATGLDPTHEQIEKWRQERRGGNVALRMPPSVVGLDVDAYDGRPGAETLRELEKACGQLPETYRSSARLQSSPESGIRFFRVPESQADALRDQPGIEIIRRGHRYAVAWPSTHPSGADYQWEDPDGHLLENDVVPYVEDLPWLPEPWLAALGAAPPDLGVEAMLAQSKPATPVGDPYGQTAAAEELNRVSRAAVGERNSTLFKAACNLAELVHGGHLDKETTVMSLVGAGRSVGLDDTEITATIRSAYARTKARPADIAAAILRDLDSDASQDLPGRFEATSEEGEKEHALARANDYLGLAREVHLTRVTREMAEPPSYAIHGPRGTGRLTTKQFARADALRGAILEATGVSVAELRPGIRWAGLASELAAASEDVDMGDDASFAGQARYWILACMSYDSAGNPASPADLAELLPQLDSEAGYRPAAHLYRDGDHLMIYAQGIAGVLNRSAIQVDPTVLRRGLLALGAKPRTGHLDAAAGRTTRRYWRLPIAAL